MDNDVSIDALLDTGYVAQQIIDGQNAVFKNGRLVYIIIDVNKPGKYFFDLRTCFNATSGEGGRTLRILFMNGATPLSLNNKTIGIAGLYPSGKSFNVTGQTTTASSSLLDFNFPLGLFQEAGIYKYQFEISDDSGNLATSHWCFFQVTQNATTMAFDWNNGVNPFDSDYNEWKNKVEQEINSLQNTLDNIGTAAGQIKDLMNSYVSNAEGFVDNALSKILSTDNTWTGSNTFNGNVATNGGLEVNGGLTATQGMASSKGLTVDGGGAWLKQWCTVNGAFEADSGIYDKGDLTVKGTAYLNGNLEVDGSVTLPNAPILKWVNNDLASALFPCEGYWYATGGSDQYHAYFLNGVSGSYIAFNKFRYTSREKDADSAILQIHANCTIPTSAFGKPIVQFGKDDLDGTDQTAFSMGGHIFQFDMDNAVLKCLGYATGNSSDNSCVDAKFV